MHVSSISHLVPRTGLQISSALEAAARRVPSEDEHQALCNLVTVVDFQLSLPLLDDKECMFHQVRRGFFAASFLDPSQILFGSNLGVRLVLCCRRRFNAGQLAVMTYYC